MTVYVPRGYGYKPMQVRCGSTAFDGGVNQCDQCAGINPAPPPPLDDEMGDMEYAEQCALLREAEDGNPRARELRYADPRGLEDENDL
jgi:hypothetical protein